MCIVICPINLVSEEGIARDATSTRMGHLGNLPHVWAGAARNLGEAMDPRVTTNRAAVTTVMLPAHNCSKDADNILLCVAS
jgi:hypothetical protein